MVMRVVLFLVLSATCIKWLRCCARNFRNTKLFHTQPVIGGPVWSTESLIRRNEYPFESHYVETEDGYILTVYRMRHGKHKSARLGPPVLLQHGLWSSSSDWIVSKPSNSLGFILADAGFDVWLSNSRGNIYSRDHVRLSPENENTYWNFSWHEMGYYDLPAVINHILLNVESKQLYYVGHSQGTTIFFVMASMRKEYNEKVKAMVGLAPVAFLNRVRSPLIRNLARVSSPILRISQITGFYKLLPEEWIIKLANELSEKNPLFVEKLAKNALRSICSYACDEVKENILHIAVAHISTGASLKQLAHFGQACRDGGAFRLFDYGKKMNMNRYGDALPPNYPLENISVPISLYYSDNDWLVHPQDVGQLYKSLPNQHGLHKIELPNFNHLDFLWGYQAKELIFDQIVSLFSDFNGKNQSEVLEGVKAFQS